jgi:predicted dehydrogenase
MKRLLLYLVPAVMVFASCGQRNTQNKKVESTSNMMVKIMTVDPGHFHAALVQKTMYDQVSPDVYVYAPKGPDLEQHLARVNSYNKRTIDPTRWNEIVYEGPDFFEKMISGKPGNVVVLAGNNMKKTDYILKSVEAGLNVLADKPMVITSENFPQLEEAFKVAAEKKVLLYDIMTERFEVTTILQKELSQKEEVFGTLQEGSEKEPSVSKISVHHFSKMVSGSPLIRPAWFFDVEQQGEGIVDVTTHLVDLVQWECFPNQIVKKEDVNMVAAKRWPTIISKDEFKGVTGLDNYPGYLAKDIKDGNLNVYANGEMVYQLKGIWAKVSVEWRYQAPPGGGDTHFSVMRGSNCDLIIRQTEAEKFLPTLYIENIKGSSVKDFTIRVQEALKTLPYDSLSLESVNDKVLRVNIPRKYRVSHEEHFGQVTARYLEYLKDGKLPEWEVPNMITKYHTTTSALQKALGK